MGRGEAPWRVPRVTEVGGQGTADVRPCSLCTTQRRGVPRGPQLCWQPGARSSWSLEQAAQGDNVSLLARALQRDSTDEAGRGARVCVWVVCIVCVYI